MLPDPLHPALVHFPIVLALLAPLVALAVLIAIRTGRAPAKAWLAVVLLQALVVGTGWLTAETGEEEEERVERVVSEEPIEAHEEAAERFLWLAGAGLVVSGAGLLPGGLGSAGRALALIVSLGGAVAVAQVGHSGGELVYRHGAALAYLDGETTARAVAKSATGQLLEGILDPQGSEPSRRKRRGRDD